MDITKDHIAAAIAVEELVIKELRPQGLDVSRPETANIQEVALKVSEARLDALRNALWLYSGNS